jgi:hypothetical protein
MIMGRIGRCQGKGNEVMGNEALGNEVGPSLGMNYPSV